MTFTAIGFFPFLLATLALSLVFGRRHRWLVLLVASYAFYCTWELPHLPLALAAVTAVSYLCAVGMERRDDPKRRRALLWLGLALNLGVLVALKYSGFLFENANALAALVGLRPGLPTIRLLASVGVSYYVLQAVSYLLDVHDRAVPAERHLGRFALSLAFFPKLVQGPIERAEGLLPQLRDPVPFTAQSFAAGAQLFLWGLFQKVAVADRLAPFVNAVYGDIHGHEGVPILVATYFFAAQLYFDFAGYTDMALGVARLFGIRLTQNFNSPYLATSVADFWRRWHVSFSSWLLDYVFRPLQLGLRDWRTWGTPIALVVTFLVSGLWHGATWCFVAWGLLHGLYLGASVLYRPWQKKLHRALRLAGSPLLKPLQVAVTFHLVCLAWVFFRAGSLGEAVWAVRHLATGMPATLARLTAGEDLVSLLFLGRGRGQFLFAVAMLACGSGLRLYFRRIGVAGDTAASEQPAHPPSSSWVRTAIYALMFYLIAFAGTATQSFIYQQF